VLVRLRAIVCAVLLPLVMTLCGCAGTVERWIVNARVNQGDVALQRGSLHEAEQSYRLALRVSPNDARARRGFAAVSEQIAQTDYIKGDLDDALATLNGAAKYDPNSVRLQALRQTFQDAKLKRQIVISNYPTYEAAGVQLQQAYAAIAAQTKLISKGLKRFDYTYDTSDLTAAIEASYKLQLDVAKDTNRLVAFRQLVESGVPASQKGGPPIGTPPSLLPLP